MNNPRGHECRPADNATKKGKKSNSGRYAGIIHREPDSE